MKKPTVLEWKCPECDKVITSIYPGQIDYNKNAHSWKCKKRKELERRG